MRVTTLAFRSFRSGELAPAWYAASNTQAYLAGLRKLENAYVMRTGGVQSRPGTLFKGTTKGNGFARLIPVVFDDAQNYVLELGNGYIRFWQDGDPIQATVLGAWANATAYTVGQVVSYLGTNYVALQSHTSNTANDRPSTGVNWTDFWYALTGTTYELPSPYTTQDVVREVQYAVEIGVVRFAHNSASRRTLTRYADNRWGIVAVTASQPSLAAPTGLATTGSAGTQTQYVVTAFDATTSRESLASASTGTTADLAALQASPETLTWNTVTGATAYRLYRNDENTGGVYGLLATVSTTTYVDAGSVFITADITTQPPTTSAAFSAPEDFPGVIGAYQQRILLSGTTGNPDVVKASRTGEPDAFSVSNPLVDADMVEWRMVGARSVRPLHFLELARKLLQFASTGEYVIEGDDSGIISPGAVNPRQLSANGSAVYPAPLAVNNTALYVQARGGIVRDLAGDAGSELTLTAAHLVDGHTIVEWAFQQVPNPIVWAVRDDGVLLSLTYVRETGVIGWARHVTDGTFESVAVVQEGTEDAVYVVVNRTIGGTKRYVERFDNRFADSPAFSDAAVRTLSRAGTMTVAGFGADLANNAYLYNLTASASVFTTADVGAAMRVKQGASWVTAIIISYTSATQVAIWTNTTVAQIADGVIASGDWFVAPNLAHLAGESVSVVADGDVLASPYNPAYPATTVNSLTIGSSPTFTAYFLPFTESYDESVVGLPYVTDVQTLDIDAAGTTIKDRGINISGLKVWVENTAAFYAGPKAPASATSIASLERMVPRDDEGYEVTTLDAGVVAGVLLASWNQTGRVFIRNVDPVPLTILGISPQGHFGGR